MKGVEKSGRSIHRKWRQKNNMAYRLYEKMARYGGRALNPAAVSITSSSFCFGVDIVNDFKTNGHCVEIYIDEEEKKLAFKAVSTLDTGFKLQYKDGAKVGNINAQTLANRFEKGRFEARKEAELWVIDVVFKEKEELQPVPVGIESTY